MDFILKDFQIQIEEKDQFIQDMKQNHSKDFHQLEKKNKFLEDQIQKLQKRLQVSWILFPFRFIYFYL